MSTRSGRPKGLDASRRQRCRTASVRARSLRLLLLGAGLLGVVLLAPGADAISLRAATSGSNGSGATTLVLSTPAGVVQNDLLLAQVTVRGGTDTGITPPAGWSLVLRTDSGTALAQALYSKVAGAAEPANHTWNFSQSRKASGGIAAYAGVDSASPIDASAGQTNPPSASVTAPSVTTPTPNTMLVGLFGSAKGTTFTPPPGMTERYDVASTGGGIGSRTASEAADEPWAAAGATGTRTATAADSAENIGQLVALRPPSVSFSLASSSGSEMATSVTITVSLSGASSLATTVDYTVGGTATGGGTDHTLAAGTVTLSAGSTSQDLSFTVSNDALDEADETVVVTLSNPGNANLGATTAHTYTITDDDPAPTVTLGLSGSPMAEAAGVATLTATLSAASGLDVTVNLAFSGTATLTDDYTRSGRSIVISAGGTSGTVTLTAVQETLDEPAETIIVDIDTVTNGAESGTQQVTASITDDDPAPTVTLSLTGSPFAEAGGAATVTATLSAASGQDVTVTLALSGTAILATDYTASATAITIAASGTSGDVTLTAVQDTVDEPDETVVVDVDAVTNGVESGAQQVTATLADDDPTPGGGGGGGAPSDVAGGSLPLEVGDCTPQGCLEGFDITASLAAARDGEGASLSWPHHDWPTVLGYLAWRGDRGDASWTLLATLYDGDHIFDPRFATGDADAGPDARYKLTFFTGHTPERGFPEDPAFPQTIPGWDASSFATLTAAPQEAAVPTDAGPEPVRPSPEPEAPVEEPGPREPAPAQEGATRSIILWSAAAAGLVAILLAAVALLKTLTEALEGAKAGPAGLEAVRDALPGFTAALLRHIVRWRSVPAASEREHVALRERVLAEAATLNRMFGTLRTTTRPTQTDGGVVSSGARGLVLGAVLTEESAVSSPHGAAEFFARWDPSPAPPLLWGDLLAQVNVTRTTPVEKESPREQCGRGARTGRYPDEPA